MRRTRRLPLEELAPYLFEEDRRGRPSDPPRAVGLVPAETIDWRALFGNDRPVEIEVGSGKGLFLLTAATQCQGVNFLGIEIVRKYQLFAATRMAVRKLANVRVAGEDAGRLLRERVPAGSVQAIHVYFPDPWWKKRHHKRRVFTPEFVASCVAALMPGGLIHLATDVGEYFAVMNQLCDKRPELEPLPTPQPAEGQDYLTNFERKARLRDQPVYRALYRKKAAAPEPT
jgi:tRNA (guanine-N7-)-methyltransferase